MKTIKVDIEKTLKALLAQEDTDGDKRITIEDQGPKLFELKDVQSGKSITVEGTYYLSNLLQEVVLAKERNYSSLNTDHIFEKPVARIQRMIEQYYWDGLTRTIDKKGLDHVLSDEKSDGKIQRIYVSFYDSEAYQYYSNLKKSFANLEVIQLPEDITPAYVLSINEKPGILALKLEKDGDELKGVPFVVPGGRFNEMYGWDSYFESVGLLLGPKKQLAKTMADNFQYEIEHYGKILNANRTYYLTRTQPPFYTSLIRGVYEDKESGVDINWLSSHLKTAIKEYETVWMVQGKRLTENGLNRYLAEGIGLPPEVEEGHYNAVLKTHAEKVGMTIAEYEHAYYHRQLENADLDTYFIHDRTVRENGHDTSYRLEGHCAHLNCVELNCFLYKYEVDFAHVIKTHFKDSFKINNKDYTSNYWEEKASRRKELINHYLWNVHDSCYYDYNFVDEKQVSFTAATSLVPLWAGIASEKQTNSLVENVLPKLSELGGISGCTEKSRGMISEERPARQWDYPNGWAPHQMMIWKGLLNYGYNEKANELIYRWLWMITKNAVNYNGTIPEKYDVVTATHKVFAEYGNVGTEFEYIAREGFGWMNASYIYGLQFLSEYLKEQLNDLVHPDTLFN